MDDMIDLDEVERDARALPRSSHMWPVDTILALVAEVRADRERVAGLEAALRAIVDAWEYDEIGQVDGGLIEDAREALSSPSPALDAALARERERCIEAVENSAGRRDWGDTDPTEEEIRSECIEAIRAATPTAGKP